MSTYCTYAIGHPDHGPYHDEEYGFPVRDERVLFERLALEINQAGLSWLTVLRKRPAFHRAFDGFDPEIVARYGETERARLLQDASIIRNRLKVDAVIQNAQKLLEIRSTHGSFADWLAAHHPRSEQEWVKLFKKTFRFTGGEIVREFLLSTGYLPGAHAVDCPVYARITELDPPWLTAQHAPTPSHLTLTHTRFLGVLAGVALALSAASAPAAAQSIDTMALRSHTSVLAHDSMRGRRTGTPGGEATVRYIAAQLAALGLQPLAQSGFLQSVPLREVTVHDSTALEVGTAGETRRFQVGRDFVVSTGGRNALRSASGAALFVGTSASALRLEASEELRDRVLVVLGPLGDDAGTLSRAWMRAGARGAVLLIPDARAFTALAHSMSERRFQVDAAVDEPVWQPDLPIVLAGPAIASALLGGVQLPAGAAPDSLPRPIDLHRTVTWTLHASTRAISAHNVAGMLPGTDPTLREDVVIFTAHWDHLGVREAVAGDSIYNGFSDNAAGVAMLLAIAQAWRPSPSPRSVAFLFTAAEEEGLLGSAYYAAAPLIPLTRTSAVINLDAGAPPVPPVSWRFAGDPTSALSEIAGEITRSHGWTPELGPARPNSDHWPFLARRVPAVFVVPGNKWEGVSDDQRNKLRERWDRYHQASDHWAVDFPFAGLQRYAALALEIGKRVASSNARQH